MTKIIDIIPPKKTIQSVFYIQSKKDITLLKEHVSISLPMEQKIIDCISKKEDNFFQFYIGSKTIDTIFVYVSQEKDKKKRQLFLGKHSSRLPKDIVIFCLNSETTSDFLETCVLSRYLYDFHKTDRKKVKNTVFVNSQTKKIVQNSLELIENITLARDLWEMPSNHLTPESFTKIIKKITFKNVTVKIISPKNIEKKWLWLIHAVGKGSENKPYMVILEKIEDKKKPTIGLVGKGITFDTGGIQVKPENSMYEMKGDMWGAAVVLGIMKQLDTKKIWVNIVACLCLAENSISSTSYKPSDVITGYTGKTVEIIHTDAEWRLVLADGISYISKNYKLSEIMTVATLTGACMVALWYRYAGIMWNNKNFIQKTLKYSQDNSEQYVQLPFDEHFLEKTKSKIADYKNLDRGVFAGSSMWGAFLYNFCENKELYTHIDIAGTYLNGQDPYGKVNSWATGFWVESLSEIISSL